MTTSAALQNTPHILRSQPGDNEGEIPLLEEERRGFLLSPVPSVVITAVRALLIGILIFRNRSERDAAERGEEVYKENDTRGERVLTL